MKIKSIFAYTLLLSTATMAMEAPDDQGHLDRATLQALITQTFGTNKQDFDQLYQRFDGDSERIWSFIEKEQSAGTAPVQSLVRSLDNLHLYQDNDLETEQKQITANLEKAEAELLKEETELQKVEDTIAQYTAQIKEQEHLLDDIFERNFLRLKNYNEMQISRLQDELKQTREFYANTNTLRLNSEFSDKLTYYKANIAGNKTSIELKRQRIVGLESDIGRCHTRNSEYHQKILDAIRQRRDYSLYNKWQEENRQEISKLQRQIDTNREEIRRLERQIESDQELADSYSKLVKQEEERLERIDTKISQIRLEITQYYREIGDFALKPTLIKEDVETVKKIHTLIAQLQHAIEQQEAVKNKIDRDTVATRTTIANLQAQRVELTQRIQQARIVTNDQVLRLLREQIVAEDLEDTAMLNHLIDSHIAKIQDYKQSPETIARELSAEINQQRQQQRQEAAAAEAKCQQEIQQQQVFTDNAFEALKTGNLEAFMANFQSLTSKTAGNPEGYQLIHVAAEYGRVREAQEIIKHAASPQRLVNVELHNGSTPLHLAAGAGHTEFVQFLLSNGADILKATPTGVTILEMALNYLEGRLAEEDTAGIENGHALIKIIEEAIAKAVDGYSRGSNGYGFQSRGQSAASGRDPSPALRLIYNSISSFKIKADSKPQTEANKRLQEELERLRLNIMQHEQRIKEKKLLQRKRMEEEQRQQLYLPMSRYH